MFGFGELNSLEDLVFVLLNEIGLGINEYGIVYDTDNYNILSFNGRQIKASTNRMNPVIPTDLFVIFDPVFDNKIMNFMLGYYLKKSEDYGDFIISTISEDFEPIQYYNKDDNIKTRRSRITAVSNVGEKTYSLYYYQKGLKYSDIILRLGKQNYDLTKFDSIPDESISIIPYTTNIYVKEDNYY